MAREGVQRDEQPTPDDKPHRAPSGNREYERRRALRRPIPAPAAHQSRERILRDVFPRPGIASPRPAVPQQAWRQVTDGLFEVHDIIVPAARLRLHLMRSTSGMLTHGAGLTAAVTGEIPTTPGTWHGNRLA